ncbi:hypothetical protein TRSC58_00963 [Trypanosoma rangeli SC58]|uniref:THH1/TOM1/TOM3 domain-containing protein n=1 Tax=Trypanosoma rangeli SC58 TaxID=429131 RepID=A0A061JAB2_TRYRA|nr:hypothetical protein TRSC58_00963 [Trypanosoma rangeli SC58]
MLIVLSLILVSIFVPVAKDANDMTLLRGGNEFYMWRRWLAPLYIAMVLYILLCFTAKLPTRKMYENLKAKGTEKLWGYTKFSFVLAILRGLSLVAFSALIACRADEVITTNYFVVLAMPFYVFGALALIEAVGYQIVIQRTRKKLQSSCFVFVRLTFLTVVVAIALVSISLVAKRLNDMDSVHHGGTENVLPLALALIPVFILLAFAFLVVLFLLCVMCGLQNPQCAECCYPPHGKEENESEEHQESEAVSGDERERGRGNEEYGQWGRKNERRDDSGGGNMQQGGHTTPAGTNDQGILPFFPQKRLSDVD